MTAGRQDGSGEGPWDISERHWVRVRLAEVRDRLLASDPGLLRLRTAVSAGVAMAGAMAVEYGFSHLLQANAQGTMVSMMLGTVVAMMGSQALTGPASWRKVRTAVFFPVAIGLGLALGVLTAGNTTGSLAMFVLVMFAAVFVRRWGADFFFYGFMGWMGFFFAMFLHPPMGSLPGLVLAVAVGTAWVLLLSLTVLRTNPRRTLRRVQLAFGARARDVARTCADLLAATDDDRRTRQRRRLHARQLRLAEAALMIEAWSAEPGALPDGWSAPALRRRLLDAQLALDALAHAADALAAQTAEADAATLPTTAWDDAETGTANSAVAAATRIAAHLARRDHLSVERLANALLKAPAALPAATGPAPLAAHTTARTTGDARAWTMAARALHGGSGAGAAAAPAVVSPAVVPSAATATVPPAAQQMAAAAREYVALTLGTAAPPATESTDVAFEPAVTLAFGNLPGSAAAAKQVTARGSSWNPLSRLSLTTRQAFQAAIAGGLSIFVGRAISEQRFYWAVIAAFIAFTGTATRSETFIKATNRVLGTLAGLFAGVALSHLTAGHDLLVLAVIVLSMACGFYLVQVSYAYMIFFVTIMVSQLYTILNEFSTGLLELRLEETAAGAAVGILVALLVLPTSTRDAVTTARSTFFTAVGAVLTKVAEQLVGPDGEHAADRTSATAGTTTKAEKGDAEGDDGTEDDGGTEPDLDALSRALDHQLRALALLARPLTRPLTWGNDPSLVRHRITLYAAVARNARALALAADRPTATADHTATTLPAAACRALAAAADLFTVDKDSAVKPAASTLPTAEIAEWLRSAETALLARSGPACSAPSSRLTLPMTHLIQLFDELSRRGRRRHARTSR